MGGFVDLRLPTVATIGATNFESAFATCVAPGRTPQPPINPCKARKSRIAHSLSLVRKVPEAAQCLEPWCPLVLRLSRISIGHVSRSTASPELRSPNGEHPQRCCKNLWIDRRLGAPPLGHRHRKWSQHLTFGYGVTEPHSMVYRDLTYEEN